MAKLNYATGRVLAARVADVTACAEPLVDLREPLFRLHLEICSINRTEHILKVLGPATCLACFRAGSVLREIFHIHQERLDDPRAHLRGQWGTIQFTGTLPGGRQNFNWLESFDASEFDVDRDGQVELSPVTPGWLAQKVGMTPQRWRDLVDQLSATHPEIVFRTAGRRRDRRIYPRALAKALKDEGRSNDALDLSQAIEEHTKRLKEGST